MRNNKTASWEVTNGFFNVNKIINFKKLIEFLYFFKEMREFPIRFLNSNLKFAIINGIFEL